MTLRVLHVVVCPLLFRCFAFSQLVVVDDLQRTVTLPAPATRIVSLAPSITESLFAVGAGEHVVGVTDYCNYPAEATMKQRVGGVINPNIETIVSLKPDLILLSMEGNVREDFSKLTSFGIPVFVTNPRTLNGIYASIEQVGMLSGQHANAVRLTKSLRAREDSIVNAAAHATKRTILVFVSLQPIIVVGSKTFFAELIELAGGVNVAAKSASTYPAYSREAVLKDNPDVLIFMSDVLSDPAELVKLYPEWLTLNAFRNKNILRVNADIVSRPGPRAVEGLEALYKFIH